MKVVILAGGLGTRISEESYLKPKPMITIGEQPILWHIMKYYSHFGFNDFIVCCGYKGHVIKEYFADYYLHRSDVTFDFSAENRMTVHQNVAEPWRVTLVDTGLNTQTGGRVKRVQKYVGNEPFMLTYGDGVSDVDLRALIDQHASSGKIVTLTGVQPGGRFGVLDLEGQTVTGFREKAKEDGGWINGGFMVMEPEVFGYLSEDESCILEREPMERLAQEGQLGIYKHGGFWQCMDTQRDKIWLEERWQKIMRHGACGDKMLDFYQGKRVFITGHTGFKGSWLCSVLLLAGADVTGYALPPAELSLYKIIGLEQRMRSVQGDIRDLDALRRAFDTAKPEIVFHLAARPIVRESYRSPVDTYSTNVMGTVHILECVRNSGSVKSFLNVTTDKVYENCQWPWGYRESDRLNGFDPYSNSKSCSELVTDSYKHSFFSDSDTAISTARAGNVIGGGDFAADRIIPDCIRAVQASCPIQIRNPASIRPYQHVLEPLSAYLLIAQRQYEDRSLAGSYNVGPDSAGCVTAQELAEMFCRAWGESARWEAVGAKGPHEDAVLKLDCSKIRAALGWSPKWNIERAIAETVVWTKEWLNGKDMGRCMEQQISAFSEQQP